MAYTIRAQVTDVSTGQPLAGASVINTVTKQGTQADATGWFSIVVDDYSTPVTISYVGYDPVTEDAGVLTETQGVELNKNGDSLGAVTVVGKKLIKSAPGVLLTALAIVLFFKIFKLI